MNTIKFVVGFAVIAGAIVMAAPQSAQATTCKIEPVVPITDIRDTGKNFTFNADGTITAKFKVTGDADCKKEAVLAVWKAPNGTNGEPLIEQKLFDYAPKTATKYGVGEHTITAKMPNCFWQLDLLEGSDPRGVDGTANYGTFLKPTRHMLDTMHGGDKECDVPVPPVQPPVRPEGGPEVKGVQTTPAELVKTGPASIAGTFVGVSSLAGIAHTLVQRRRKV